MAENTRRKFLSRALAGAGTLSLSGCYDVSQTQWWPKVLDSAENVSRVAQRFFAGRNALAQEFTKADISPMFKANGATDPASASYKAMAAKSFADWRIAVNGLVDRPLNLSIADLKRLPSRTQITRHRCAPFWRLPNLRRMRATSYSTARTRRPTWTAIPTKARMYTITRASISSRPRIRKPSSHMR
jgi:DMSO/TMAO reductase YedYZ molybdopterin-dependent catalytic subunit